MLSGLNFALPSFSFFLFLFFFLLFLIELELELELEEVGGASILFSPLFLSHILFYFTFG